MAIPIQVVFDCADPARIASFWAGALGYVIQPPPEGFSSWEGFLTSIGVSEDRFNDRSAIVDPDGVGPRIFFQRVPEGKSVKNRVHLDVNAGGRDSSPDERRENVASKVEELAAGGATVVREVEEMGDHWFVMQDPEGNEFCVQ